MKMTAFKRLFMYGLKNPVDAIQLMAHLPKFIKLYVRLFKDRRVPLYLKVIVVLAFVYLISPIDLIPDFFVPVLGQVDDLFVLTLGLKWFLKKCPREVLMEHVHQIESEG